MVALQKEQISTEALASVLEEKLSGWKQIVILGIGNEFSGDDSLGFQAARKLKRALSNTSESRSPNRGYRSGELYWITAETISFPCGTDRCC